MASMKRKTIGFKTEEELANVVNETVNEVIQIQKAATHDITRWNITEGMFSISSLYLIQFLCNYFFTEIMKEGAVGPLNGWNFNAPGYLNSWQPMC